MAAFPLGRRREGAALPAASGRVPSAEPARESPLEQPLRREGREGSRLIRTEKAREGRKEGARPLGTPPAAAPLSARRALRPAGPAAGTRGPGLRPRPPQPRAAPRSAAAGAPEQWRRRGRRAEGPAGGAATKAGEDGERGGEAAPAGRAYLVELLAHIGVDVDVVHAVRHDPTRGRRQPRPAPEPPPGGGGSGEAELCVTSAAAQRGFRLRRAEGRSSCPARPPLPLGPPDGSASSGPARPRTVSCGPCRRCWAQARVPHAVTAGWVLSSQGPKLPAET